MIEIKGCESAFLFLTMRVPSKHMLLFPDDHLSAFMSWS